MPKKNKVQAAITAYVTPDIRNKFNEICQQKGLNASSVIRQFVLQTVEQNQ